MRLKLYDANGVTITTVDVDAEEYFDACDIGFSLKDQYPNLDEFDVLFDDDLEATAT